MTQSSSGLFRLTAIFLISLLPLTSGATTRLVLGFDELVSASSLIFIGTVEEVVVSDVAGIAYSTVRFTIDEVVKGDETLASVDLRFVGGATASIQTEITGQFIPQPGASGLWFVDDTSRELVNPLTGWSQGYFPIFTKADGSRWLDLQDHPDYATITPEAPLAGKMRAFNFPAEEIARQYPRVLEFPLDDFIAAITAVEQGLAE